MMNFYDRGDMSKNGNMKERPSSDTRQLVDSRPGTSCAGVNEVARDNWRRDVRAMNGEIAVRSNELGEVSKL